jgi:ribosomal protein L7/L12
MSNDLWVLFIGLAVLGLWILIPLNDRFRRIEAKLDRLLALQGIDKKKWHEPSAEVIQLAKTGEQINALKLYRKQTGADLKEAKEIVELHTNLNSTPPKKY